MPDKLYQQLTVLQDVLVHLATPRSYDETYLLAAKALRQTLGEVRILFYLAEHPPERDPLSSVPCSARQLDLDLFIHDALNRFQHFNFETHHPHYASIVAASCHFGFIFLERKGPPLDEWEQSLVTLIATQTAHHLNHLSWPNTASKNRINNLRSLIIDRSCHQVWINNISVQLTVKEFATIELLYHNRGHTCSRALICQTIYSNEVSLVHHRQDRLDKVIYKLRKKFGQIEYNPIIINTVRGLGYRLEQIF